MPHWSSAAHRTVCAQAWLGRVEFVACSKQQGGAVHAISPVPLPCVASNLLLSALGACMKTLLLWLQ